MIHKNPKTDRAVAISVISDVLDTGAFANIALRKTFATVGLDVRERAFVTDLVNETLRNLIHIDHILNQISKTPVDKMKPFIRSLMRISVCQIKFMEKVPESAAVNEAVKLAKSYGFHNLSGYVNGVLRNVVRAKTEEDIPVYLKYSYPKWLMDSLVEWLGTNEALTFCENSHQPPPVVVLANIAKTSKENLAEIFKKEEIDAIPLDGKHPFFMLRKTGDITRLDSFTNGLFFVMDPGAIFAVEQVIAEPNQTIIDLCAAPGGKSFAIAGLMQGKGQILAYDIHPHRIELVRQTSKRLSLPIISASVGDATKVTPSLVGKADTVLLDAPCSGLGTIRKHPEIKYSRDMQGIKELVDIQRQMLGVAAQYVKVGGKLVYCTCTIVPQENSENINDFLRNNTNYALVQDKQIMPDATNDAFYVAQLKRLY